MTGCVMFRKFFRREDGLATVDYVVLTALATGIGIASTDLLKPGVNHVGDRVQMALANEMTDTGGGGTQPPEPSGPFEYDPHLLADYAVHA